MINIKLQLEEHSEYRLINDLSESKDEKISPFLTTLFLYTKKDHNIRLFLKLFLLITQKLQQKTDYFKWIFFIILEQISE